jgi:hypothetical protein
MLFLMLIKITECDRLAKIAIKKQMLLYLLSGDNLPGWSRFYAKSFQKWYVKTKIIKLRARWDQSWSHTHTDHSLHDKDLEQWHGEGPKIPAQDAAQGRKWAGGRNSLELFEIFGFGCGGKFKAFRRLFGRKRDIKCNFCPSQTFVAHEIKYPSSHVR